MVWQPRNHGMVGRLLAQRGLRQLYGVQVNGLHSPRLENGKLPLLDQSLSLLLNLTTENYLEFS